jgi:hypothetical protein
MRYMLCKQNVDDFAEFTKSLASHDAVHQESGFRVQRIWRDLDKPGRVFFLCEVWDVAKARDFVKAETLRLQEAGVSEFPDIHYLGEA